MSTTLAASRHGEFLRSLDSRAQIRFEWSIERLRVRNIEAQEPLVRHLEAKVW